MSAYDDYSHAVAGENHDDNYEKQRYRDVDEARDDSTTVDLRIPASTAELDEREAALIKLENSLLEKSQQIQERDQRLQGSGVVEDNWPCSLYAITYHSIRGEIPTQYQSFVRKHYWILKLTMFALSWNFLSLVVMYIEDAASATQLWWGTIYFLTGVPGSWKLWYKAIYRAVGSDKRAKFVQYFLFGASHTIFCIVATIGVQETSLMGFLFMIDAINVNEACGIFAVIACGAWAVIALASVIMMRQTYRLYKSRGGDLQEDSAALRSNVANNVATGRMVLQGVNAVS